MRIQPVLIGILAASIAGQANAQDEASSDDIDDQMAYVTSFVAPAMTELCASLVPTYPTELEASLQKWLSRNRESIDRGEQLEISHLWPGKTIEEFEQMTVEATIDSFNAATDDLQLKHCKGMLMSISDDEGTGGA
jgi:hypothetical protein